MTDCDVDRQQYRCDYLESLGYMLLYLLQGRLPWDDIDGLSFQGPRITPLMMERKKRISIEELCDEAPLEFREYFRHVRALGSKDKPGYSDLRAMFQNLFLRCGFKHDNVFDWR